MSSTGALETNEDLENVTLVRMEDVQPDRSSELYGVLNMSPCIINKIIDHDYICVVNDDDSNIGSMVSIQSEEIEDCIETTEFIEHEVLKPVIEEKTECTSTTQDSWPTLEILPGGVIKQSEKFITAIRQSRHKEVENKDLMYACAKCPQRFQFLYSLVKHVKLHEDEQKKQKLNVSQTETISDVSTSVKHTYTQTKKRKVPKCKTKCKVPKK